MYLNDILIYSKNLIKHENDVLWMLQQLNKYDLYVNFDKYRFNVIEIHFLNYVIFSQKIIMQKNKFDAIRNWFTSRNINDIQIFFDLINFYRRFIKNFNRIVASLSNMLKNSSKAFRKNKLKKRKQSSNSLQNKQFLIIDALKAFENWKLVLSKNFC